MHGVDLCNCGSIIMVGTAQSTPLLLLLLTMTKAYRMVATKAQAAGTLALSIQLLCIYFDCLQL